VYATQGKADLFRPLTRLIAAACDPGPVHRFFATLPHRLEQLGLEPRYQLIVTTNFDSALERAFDAAEEPYDLAVFMASGPDKDHFVHFAYDDPTPRPITVANEYVGFPIDEEGGLARTVIVKARGAVDAGPEFRWRENCIVTEDQHIGYLSGGSTEGLVPTQLLGKLRDSHCLFLGYTMREWWLRVLPNRIWSDRGLEAKSWICSRRRCGRTQTWTS
jgi:hypothetical protein